MNLHSLIPSRTMLTVLCGLGLVASLATSPARADEWNKKTILTVNDTIQVIDTVLQPGQYVLKLLDSASERHVVQIFNSDQTHIINTVIAINTERLQPTGHSAFTFWETPPGNVRALRTWYYPGDNYGQMFLYPKHLQQVAMLMTTPAPVPAAEPVANPEPAPAEPAPAAEPAAEAPAQPAPEEQPAEVAQSTAPAETPAQSTPDQPAQLPKTGSLYPEIGLCGALMLGFAGLLRLRRQA
jgi:outer membrane biosynthesis protein TonB